VSPSWCLHPKGRWARQKSVGRGGAGAWLGPRPHAPPAAAAVDSPASAPPASKGACCWAGTGQDWLSLGGGGRPRRKTNGCSTADSCSEYLRPGCHETRARASQQYVVNPESGNTVLRVPRRRGTAQTPARTAPGPQPPHRPPPHHRDLQCPAAAPHMSSARCDAFISAVETGTRPCVARTAKRLA
jgi:hypothetical protein